MRREKKNQSISLKELIGKMKRHSTLSITVTAGLSAILCGTIIYLLLPVPKASASELPAGTDGISSDMTEQMGNFNDEVNAINEKINNGQKSINEIIKQNNTQLEKMDHTKEELETIKERGETLGALGDKFTDLASRMDKLDESVIVLQQYITESNSLSTKNSENISSEIKKINDQYATVTQQLSDITKAYDQVKSDLSAAIAKLSEKSSSEHDEIIEALNTVNSDLLTDSSTNFQKLSKELTSFSESSLIYLEALQADIDDKIGKVDNNITNMNENINNQSEKYLEQSANSSENLKQLITNTANDNSKSLKEINDNTTNWFTQIKEEYGSGNDGLIQMVNDLRTDMSSGFEKVFQSVGDGKKLVASALLTKDVDIKDDATFKEIHDAILSIPQEIVVGVDRLPGEISYEYHHHKDAQGKDCSDVQKGVGEKGGCYTVPVYHVHTGDIRNGGGCYTVPVYHYHSGSCYSTFSYSAKTDNIVDHCGEVNGDQVFEYHCNDCGSTFRGTNGWHTHSDRVLVCGRGSGSIERYSPGCGMDNTTVVGYGTGCGLADGQITGAHIIYIQGTDNTENSEPVMTQSMDIAAIGSHSLLSEEDQKKLIEDKKKAAEAREKAKPDPTDSSNTADSQSDTSKDSTDSSDSSNKADSQSSASKDSTAPTDSSNTADSQADDSTDSSASTDSSDSSNIDDSQSGDSSESNVAASITE